MSFKRQRSGSMSGSKYGPYFDSYKQRSGSISVGYPQYSTKVYRAKKPQSKPVRGVSKKLRSAVKALISNSKEQKIDVDQVSATNLIATTAAVAPVTYNMVPDIGQGNTVYTRVGDDIEITSSKLKVSIAANPTTAVPMVVQLWLGYVNRTPFGPPSLADQAQLLYIAGSTTGPLLTNTSDTRQCPVNEDYWTIKFRKDYKVAVANATGGQNNDFQALFEDEIDIGKLIKKKQSYNGTDVNPTGSQLFLFFTVTGVNASASANFPVVQYTLTTRFTDA